MYKQNSLKSFKWICSILLPFFFYAFYGSLFYSCLGLGIFIFFSFEFFINLSYKIEIRDIVVVVCSLQWVVGAILAYKYLPYKFIYYMAVPEEQYMQYVVPALVFYIAGLYLPFYKSELDHSIIKLFTSELLDKYHNLDIYLILSGFLFGYLSKYVPESLYFLFYLFESLKFIGLFYLLLSKRKNKIVYSCVVIGGVIIDASRGAIFSTLMLWIIFSFIVFAFVYEFSFKKKIIIILIGIFMIFILQSVKYQFREIVWTKGSDALESSKILAEMMISKFYDDNLANLKDYELDMLISRINQGWIIARIMSRVPTKEPYANGETIIRSLKDSILPRFLNPGKMKAGGYEYFERFTGKKLIGTSMDLSVVGEAYANWGRNGGFFFMFCFGLCYNIILYFVYRTARKNPTIFLWIPILFLFAIKAETGFYMIANHLIKASFFVIVIFYLLNKIHPNFHNTYDASKS